MKNELKNLCNAHHFLNLLLSTAFPVTKLISPIPTLLYNQKGPGLDSREREILIFLAVILVWKNRKSANYLHTLSTSYLFAKLAGAALFFRANPLYGIVYSVSAIATFILIPEQLPAESNKIHYFRGNELQKTLQEDKSVVWVIEFFSTWSDTCRYMAPIFSTLSENYSLPNLCFGKLDVGKYTKEGEHFRVNSHTSSKQLPTISVFKNGIQTVRRPLVENQRAVPFVFNQENIIFALGLNTIYGECKAKLRK